MTGTEPVTLIVPLATVDHASRLATAVIAAGVRSSGGAVVECGALKVACDHLAACVDEMGNGSCVGDVIQVQPDDDKQTITLSVTITDERTWLKVADETLSYMQLAGTGTTTGGIVSFESITTVSLTDTHISKATGPPGQSVCVISAPPPTLAQQVRASLSREDRLRYDIVRAWHEQQEILHYELRADLAEEIVNMERKALILKDAASERRRFVEVLTNLHRADFQRARARSEGRRLYESHSRGREQQPCRPNASKQLGRAGEDDAALTEASCGR